MHKINLSKEAKILLSALYQHHLEQQSFLARLKRHFSKATPILEIDDLSLAQRSLACQELLAVDFISMQTKNHLYGEFTLTEQGIEYARLLQ